MDERDDGVTYGTPRCGRRGGFDEHTVIEGACPQA
jgi:hypothetical protein